MENIDLSLYQNKSYRPGNFFKRSLWYLIHSFFFDTKIPHSNLLKISLLRLFGAEIDKGVLIKPDVKIKYPWFLKIGKNVWIGEEVWLDNLAQIEIGNNVCISQGAYIGTGNHNYTKKSFDLMVSKVIIEDGVWVGAKSIVSPGITLSSHSVITMGSVVTKNTLPYTIYHGNPAKEIKKRFIN